MTALPRVARTSAFVALVLATVWLVWPTGLGGETTYVTTHGVSMQPRFHTGDLAVLSPADAYSVGDVVAYRSPSLKTIVMHRIVSVDGEGFVTKGDNNTWLDQDRPTQRDILGRLFVRVPHGGRVLDALRSPGVLLPLVGGLLALFGTVHDPRGRRTLRWMRRRVPVFTMSTRGRARQAALGAGVAVLVSAVGCGVLLAMPSTQTDTQTLHVVQKSQYAYFGKAAAGTTYPRGAITTGDTVWNRLVDHLTATLTTSVSGAGLSAVTGSVHLDVVVAAADGWSSVVTSGAPAVYANGTVIAAVAIDADAAAQRLNRHYEETGSPRGSATLSIRPVTRTTGTVHGHGFTAGPPRDLTFTLDTMSLRPTSTDGATLAPTTVTSVTVDVVSPRRVSVLAASVPIGAARRLMGALLLLSLVVAGLGAWIGRIGRADVSGRFLARHADRILPVASFTPGATVIDVSDAESLHRVAERFDTLVLHHAGEHEDVFAVRDVDATYRFVMPATAGRRPDLPPVPAPAAGPAPVPADATLPLERVAAAGPVYGSGWRVA